MTADLFDAQADPQAHAPLHFDAGACLLRGAVLDEADALLADVQAVLQQAPLRHLVTPGGKTMSVAMSNCGALGWVSDAGGYRYQRTDPQTGRPWPAMPPRLHALARRLAQQAGYAGFDPDACLVNRYTPGARLTLHQDRDERGFGQPIVSVSLGLPAVFLWGGARRGDRTRRLPLAHGDALVWGGPSRLHHHGVLPLAEGTHPLLGPCRINLTFRRAG